MKLQHDIFEIHGYYDEDRSRTGFGSDDITAVANRVGSASSLPAFILQGAFVPMGAPIG